MQNDGGCSSLQFKDIAGRVEGESCQCLRRSSAAGPCAVTLRVRGCPRRVQSFIGCASSCLSYHPSRSSSKQQLAIRHFALVAPRSPNLSHIQITPTMARRKAGNPQPSARKQEDDFIADNQVEVEVEDDDGSEEGIDDDGDEEGTEDASQPPSIDDPYAALQIPPTASPSQIKSAYRRLSLLHHPDKATGAAAATATQDFQRLTAAYALLSDPARRQRFDTTGSTADVLFADDDTFSWADFYRDRYADVITDESIAAFEKEYKGSAEERTAVLAMYAAVQGNMNRLFERVMLAEVIEDEARFRRIIDAAIASGEAEALDAYTLESDKSRKARMDKAVRDRKREQAEVEQHKEETMKKRGAKKAGKKGGGEGGLGELAAMIRGKHASQSEDFLSRLEEKYGGGKKGKRSEPPAEAFERNAKKSKKTR